jgi:hypothetical protein
MAKPDVNTEARYINDLSKRVTLLELTHRKNILDKKVRRKEAVFSDLVIESVERIFRDIESGKTKEDIIAGYRRSGVKRKVFNIKALLGIW